MRHPFIRLGAAVLLVALMAACSRSAVTPRPTVPAALPGTSWTKSIQAGSAPAAQSLPTISFGTDGTVSGWGGCANYTGSFTVNGSSISITGLAKQATAQTCAPETVADEDDFLAALAGATTWQTGTTDDLTAPGQEALAPIKLVLTGSTTLYLTMS
jgi:heat shock protein HslJ